jgi:hypothetical protein
MRFLFRWAFRLFLVLLVAGVALLLLKDTLLREFAEHRIESGTGLQVKIGKLESGILSPKLAIENLKIFNPPEFGGSAFVDIPEFYAEWHASSIATRKLRFKFVRIHLHEVNIVENRNGTTNAVALLSDWTAMKAPNATPPEILGLQFAGIDVLNLTIGKVRHSSLKNNSKQTEVDFGLKNEVITNIKTIAELNDAIMTALLRKGVTISPSEPRKQNGAAQPKRKAP